jgi:excisionase family DNA binding protein
VDRRLGARLAGDGDAGGFSLEGHHLLLHSRPMARLEGRDSWKGGVARSEPTRGSVQMEPLLRPEGVARLLGCSPKTVYAWAASGSIPCVRLGRLVRFRPADVRLFVEAHIDGALARPESPASSS